MAFKLIVLLCAVSVARGGVIGAAFAPGTIGATAIHSIQAPAITSQSQNILRSYDGSQTVASYSKSIDTAFSSVNKHDTRISNDGQLISPIGYAAYSAPTYAAPLVQKTFATPAIPTYSAHLAPAVNTYSAPSVTAYAPHQAPAVATYDAAPVAIKYTPAYLASHVSYTGLGVNYGW